jgi:hypothetical protein
MARSKIFYPALAGLLICGLAGGTAMVLAQGGAAPAAPKPKAAPALPKAPPPAPKPAQPEPPASPQAAPASADAQAAPRSSPFEDDVKRLGLKTCAKGFVGLGQGVLPPQSEFASQLQWNKQNADGHSVQSLVGIRASDQNIAGVVFASPVGGVCEGQFVRVTPIAGSCSAVARELTPKSIVQANLGQIPVIATPEGPQIMLVPAGESACVIVLVGRLAS